jgi:alpha-D-ribose 1-methylphosphonate 5-triphosphate synthase subunit PhnH
MPDPILVTEPGLSDPVGQSQEIFRIILAVLAEPGRVQAVHIPLGANLPIDRAALAVLLTLADGDTPIWTGGDPESALAAYLRFHTGAPIVTDPRAARFAVITDPHHYVPLSRFDPGIEDFPDRSATVLISVKSLREGGSLVLRGPGIPERRHLEIHGLPPGFHGDWLGNQAGFPCGVDVIFTCGTDLAGLPRSITLESPCT